jgi:hypothetical protein
MSNRTTFVNQTLKKETLLNCFREAIQQSDARNRRTGIGETLRLADINTIDGLELLFYALKEKYEPNVLVEKRQISAAPTAPTHKSRDVMGASTHGETTQGEFKCESCGKDYVTAKALSGHGPQRCSAKTSQMI